MLVSEYAEPFQTPVNTIASLNDSSLQADRGDNTDKRPVHGSVKVAGKTIHWHENDGKEIVFFQSNQPDTSSLQELELNKQDRLNLINQLLAHYRNRALPKHNAYYAAAAGVTKNGNLYMGFNNEHAIHDPYSGRGCAETSVLHKAQTNEGTDVQLKSVYLMSAMAEKVDEKLVDKVEDKNLGCPCGECRQNLRAHLSEKSKFILVPSNDGSMVFTGNRSANSPSELRPDEVWEVSYNKIYPIPEKVDLSPEKYKAEYLEVGYHYITAQDIKTDAIATRFSDLSSLSPEQMQEFIRENIPLLVKSYQDTKIEIPGLKDDPSLSNINTALLHLLENAYNGQKESIQAGKNFEISVAIIKTKGGDFVPATHVVADWLAAKPPLLPRALANANNPRGQIEAVYMMTFDKNQIEEELRGNKMHRLKMPDPAELGRLIKNMKPETDPKMTVIPINYGNLDDNRIKDISQTFSIREAFGIGFSNPKTVIDKAQSKLG